VRFSCFVVWGWRFFGGGGGGGGGGGARAFLKWPPAEIFSMTE